MGDRDFVEVVNKMLEHIPKDDILKKKLHKMLEKYSYMAPEIKNNIWGYTHNLFKERFANTEILDLPEWGFKILNIWANKE